MHLSPIRIPPCLAPVLGGAVLLLASCSPAPALLRIDLVSPSQLPAPRSALLLVEGQGFRQGDTVSLTQGETVGLGTRALTGNVWVNDQLLSAALPADLALGRYDVVVTDTQGRQAIRSNALQIGTVATATATAAVASASPVPVATEPPRTKATLPPSETRTPTERPRPTATPSPTETPTPAQTAQATPFVPPPQPPTVQAAAGTAASGLNVTGHWQLVDTIQPGGEQVAFADLVLQQQGTTVTGNSPDGLRSISGVLQGNTLRANYVDANGTSGIFVWTFSADGSHFSGSFTATGVNSGDSSGARISGASLALPPAVQVVVVRPGRGQGQNVSRVPGSRGGD
jgi:hypothetical protein